jgi:hypothetical protein
MKSAMAPSQLINLLVGQLDRYMRIMPERHIDGRVSHILTDKRDIHPPAP